MTAGWMNTTLGEVAEVVSGATPKTSVEEYWNGGIQWVTPKDLSVLEGHTIGATPRTISESGLRSCGAKLLPQESVLLSSRAPIGHVAINTVPMATNQGFKSLVPDPKLVDSKFLYWWLRCHRPMLESLGSGATFKEISKTVTASVPIHLPPVGQQRRIAAVLDAADTLRAKRRQALAKLDMLTQATFIDMFGASREMAPLSDLLEDAELFLDGDWVETKDQDPEGAVRLTQLADIGVGAWLSRSRRFMNTETAARLGCTYLRAGDVLVARMPDPIGRACIFPGDDMPCVTAVDVCILRLGDHAGLDPRWLVEALNLPTTRQQVERLATGTTRSRISRRNLGRIELPVVPFADQLDFTARASAVERMRRESDGHRLQSDLLFSALQQRAFRGEL